MVRILIRRDLCVGAGLCALSAGAIFSQSDEDGLVVLLNERPERQDVDRVLQAANRCPSQAIVVEQPGPAAARG